MDSVDYMDWKGAKAGKLVRQLYQALVVFGSLTPKRSLGVAPTLWWETGVVLLA